MNQKSGSSSSSCFFFFFSFFFFFFFFFFFLLKDTSISLYYNIFFFFFFYNLRANFFFLFFLLTHTNIYIHIISSLCLICLPCFSETLEWERGRGGERERALCSLPLLLIHCISSTKFNLISLLFSDFLFFVFFFFPNALIHILCCCPLHPFTT